MPSIEQTGTWCIVVEAMEEGGWAFVGSAVDGVGFAARVLAMVEAVPGGTPVAVSRGPSGLPLATMVLDGSMGHCREAWWRERLGVRGMPDSSGGKPPGSKA